MTREITFMSFGFGFPQVPAAALVFDVRPLLPDPYEDLALRAFTGRDRAVREQVLGQPNTAGVLDLMDATPFGGGCGCGRAPRSSSAWDAAAAGVAARFWWRSWPPGSRHRRSPPRWYTATSTDR